MIKKLIPVLAIASTLSFAACHESDAPYEFHLSSSVIVTGFSLSEDEKVLDSLENVFFSIDLVEAKIYNADSLPYGTKVSRLVPVISTPSTASMVQLEYPRPGMSDSIVDYLTNSTDSIDFSNGPVKLRVKSQSGMVERVYEIKVNVHQVKADTLAWYSVESAPLPTSMARPDAQRTVEFGGTYYCLTSKDTEYSLATTANPADPNWQNKAVAFGFDAKVESLRATDDALYILDKDGALYTSTDFATWTSTGQTWHYAYGKYGNQLIGCKQEGGKWVIANYPENKTWIMPANFPISGTSEPACYTPYMGTAMQLVMTGGRTAEGNTLAGSWSFDGQSWAYVTLQSMPYALEDMAMVPYAIFETSSSNWVPTEVPALLAFGGRDANGSINPLVLYSLDWGMSWQKAPTLMQMPESLPKVWGASAFVYSTEMSDAESRAGDWTKVGHRGLFPQCAWPWEIAASRVSKPVTEWECPAIYMLGGRNYFGETQTSMWRGVILRYTFKPLY
ncbi:MAG: hypothetical protein K2N16_01300 [Muribaculaceae bacterium]|nr:hypothetical protein [Muribaculaceae bacterium]